MALTDLNSTGPVFDPARVAKTFRDGMPGEALVRLSALHHQASRDLHLSQFLAGAPRFCIALMLTGAVTLVWTSREEGSAPIRADFATDFIWATSILIGIAAMTRTCIRGFARSPSEVPLEDAASELRMLLLYTGIAWSSGALLIMPALPSPALALAFAIGPSLACVLTLKDEKGVIAFSAPATLLTAGAALLSAASIWVAALVLVAGAGLVGFSMLQCAIRRRRASLPILALR